jgi:hypothetical protein
MKCQRCESDRILDISGKCSDCCGYSLKGKQGDGYVPSGLGVGGGDYLEVIVCLDCGQLQGTFPCPQSELEEEMELEKTDPFKRGDLVEFEHHGCLIIGEVTGFDRDNREVKIEAIGTWSEGYGTLVSPPVRPGPRPYSKSYQVDQDEVKITNKEW